MKSGSDAVADEAAAKIDRINAFLRQPSATHETMEKTEKRMQEIVDEGS